MSEQLERLVSRYRFDASTNKSSRRRDVYTQAAEELQRVLEGKQSLWWTLSLYKDLSLFELNATKRGEINKILNELREIWENSQKFD